jgi:two-component system capsular synthesis sensor histidine kinase RcsC
VNQEDVPLPPSREALGGARVLVIDDEESIRVFLAAALTHLGCRPRLAASGEEGLAVFAGEPFDIVLTDVGLPGISGEEVARAISERSPHTPVMLLTGWGAQLAAQGKPLEGVTRVLAKPISINTLAAALAEVCPERL